MIVDGKEISAAIKERLMAQPGAKPVLAVVVVGDNPASEVFIKVKKKFGEAIGVSVRILAYQETIDQIELAEAVTKLSLDKNITGLVIQLPLPKHLKTEKILALIPAKKDPDALGSEPKVPAPVIGAIAEILIQNKINLANAKTLVVGQGRLVGRPVAKWLAAAGAEVTVADEFTGNLPELLKKAEIIVSGVGRPHFIKPAMIKEGVILIDAGTSEQAGKLAGDADPACAAKCSLFTPVPGGVGPITVAKLFENLFELISKPIWL